MVAEAVTPNFRVMDLIEVTVPLPSQHAVVLLAESEAPHRTLSFPVGLSEGAALVAAVERVRGVRPSTQELFSKVLATLNCDVIALRLTEEIDGVIYADLDLMTRQGREIISCRPSDGLALAIRQGVRAPILADERLLS